MIRRSAFTLVELLVVISIASILLLILLPSLSLVRDVGNSAKCQVNLRSLGQGWYNYSTDHDQYVIPGLCQPVNSPIIGGLPVKILWFDNPNLSNGNAQAGLNHEGLFGGYITAPTTKVNSAYGCPGDPFYSTTLAYRITYNYSYNMQSQAIAGVPDSPGTYYWTGPQCTLSNATGNGYNRLSRIKTQPSQVGILADGYYTSTAVGGPYALAPNRRTDGVTCYQATASDPTLVPLGNFADPLGSTTVQTGSTIYYCSYHPNKTTNIVFIDGHAGPMSWQDLASKYPEKSSYSYPFAFN